jgi:putative transposase
LKKSSAYTLTLLPDIRLSSVPRSGNVRQPCQTGAHVPHVWVKPKRAKVRRSRAPCVETHENWLEAHRYLNMDYLRELKKQTLRQVA